MTQADCPGNLNQLANSLHQGVIIFDGQMNIIQINRAAERLLGIAAADLLGASIHRLDINARSRAEELFDKAFMENPCAMSISRLENGLYIEVNHALKKILGFDRKDMIGKTTDELQIYRHPEDRQKVVEAIRSTGRASNLELEFRSKDGHTKIGLFNAELIELRGERVLLSAVIDITEQRQAETQKDLLQQMLKDIFDHMPSFLCSLDSRGNISQWNRQAELNTGITRDDAIGRQFSELMSSWPEVNELVQRCLLKAAIIQKELEIPAGHREAWPADITAYPLANGAESGVVLRIDDVTERKHLLNILVQTEKMLSIGGIAAGMAHEINNPLGGILQALQNIFRRLDPAAVKNQEIAASLGINLDRVRDYMDTRQILHFMDGIRNSGERAARIVQSMLQFSRNSASSRGLHSMPAMLDDVLELAAADHDINTGYDFRHITIVREFEPGLKPVLCCRTEIEQVLLNLVTNAAQALGKCLPASETGSPRIVVRAYSDDKWAMMDVEDNGPGMSEDTAHHVFEPFYTTKAPGEGTGLGLSISYFIITNNHQGDIQVRSSPGHGTCFTIRLPYEEQ